jgi:mono/diheme cytochrome c family protein
MFSSPQIILFPGFVNAKYRSMKAVDVAKLPGAQGSLARSTTLGRFIEQYCAYAILACCAFAGCGRTEFPFRPNELHAASLVRESGDMDPKPVAADAAKVVEAWFGTPDAPKWPSDLVPEDTTIVVMEEVARCAGAVGRAEDEIERGLFRKHCVVCHGITGDGYGPAASLLAPYPRDFRRGSFKFKSTPVGYKPTREDLRKTPTHGIPGTSMPSFQALNQSPEFAEDIDSLIEYVRFLSIRGEVERRLISKAVREGMALDTKEPEAQQIAISVIQRWKDSEGSSAAIPEPPSLSDSEMAESIRRGRDWYANELTACVKCHGPEGRGDGPSQDYDEWTKDWTVLAGIDPKHPSEWKEMKPFGALKPVLDRPRNFTWKSFRGGGEAKDLFQRLVVGIEGTPMPPIARAEGGNPGLTDDQIWDLVHYVLSVEDDS